MNFGESDEDQKNFFSFGDEDKEDSFVVGPEALKDPFEGFKLPGFRGQEESSQKEEMKLPPIRPQANRPPPEETPTIKGLRAPRDRGEEGSQETDDSNRKKQDTNALESPMIKKETSKGKITFQGATSPGNSMKLRPGLTWHSQKAPKTKIIQKEDKDKAKKNETLNKNQLAKEFSDVISSIVPQDNQNQLNADVRIQQMRQLNDLRRKMSVDVLRKVLKVDELIQKIENQSFSWDSFPYDEVFFFYKRLTQLPDISQVSIFPISHVFRAVITPAEIQMFVSKKFEGTTGSIHYRNMLRFISCLIRGFYGYYLKHSLAYDPKIDADMIPAINPFHRCRTRQINRSHADLIPGGLYNSDSFNLKSFVRTCLQRFFFRTNSIWAQSFHFGYYYVLLLVEALLSYGLYNCDEMLDLLSLILKKSDQLVTLEVNCERKFSAEADSSDQNLRQEMLSNLRKSRCVMADIITHIICYYNDADVVILSGKTSDFDFIWEDDKTSKPTKGREGFKNLFVQNIKVTRRCTEIVFSYLLRECRLQGDSLITEELYGKITKNIFPFYFEKKDAFSKSLDFLPPRYIAYYFYEEELKRELRKEAKEIRKEFKNLIKNFVFSPSMSDQEQLLRNSNKAIERVLGVFERNQKNEFCVQIILTELNFCDIIIAFLRYSIEVISMETQERFMMVLTRICRDNYIGQAKMFEKGTFSHIESIQKVFPMRIAQLFCTIFHQDAFLLHNHVGSWTKIMKMYEEIIEQAEKESTDEKALIGLFFYNKLIQETLLQWEKSPEIRRGVLLLQTKIYLALARLITEKVLPLLTCPESYTDYEPIIIDGMVKPDYNPLNSSERTPQNSNQRNSLMVDVYLGALRAFNKATKNSYPKVAILLHSFILFSRNELKGIETP